MEQEREKGVTRIERKQSESGIREDCVKLGKYWVNEGFNKHENKGDVCLSQSKADIQC